MTSCLWCKQSIMPVLTLFDLVAFKAIKEKSVCDRCYAEFELINSKESCPVCSRSQSTTEMCNDCKRWKKKYTHLQWKHHAIFKYNLSAKSWMERFKFIGDIRVADMFSEILEKKVQSLKGVDLIVPIPIAKGSYEKRGFNQVEILLKTANIAYHPLLVNQALTKQQSSKNRVERLNTEQPFQLLKEKPILKDQKILIVDDVYTTGRTILHAAECLHDAGAKEIQSLSLFR